MTDALLPAYVFVRTLTVSTAARLARAERGEGVISAAIAVLVMAFLGALMWGAFKTLFDSTSNTTTNQVQRIGQ